MMKKISTTLLAVAALGVTATDASAQITGFTKLATEAQLLAPQGAKADFDANALTVGPTGVIYLVDADAGTPSGQSILRVTPGSPSPTVELMADNAAIVAAIEAVNGTSTVTSFSPRGVGVAANGNIIVMGFTSATNADTLLSLSNAAPATITVLHTSVDGANSIIDGAEALTIIGNTAYVATNENNGNATTADSIVAFDVTGSGPALAGTTIINKAALEAAYGVAGESWANHLTNNGTDLFAIISGSATAPDVVGKITTAGVATVHVDKTSIVAALAALDAGATTDLGYGAIAIDPTGTLYLGNSFGNAGSSFDDSIIVISNISGGTGTVTTIAKSGSGGLTEQLGVTAATPFLANDSFAYDSTNNRIVFSEGSQTPANAEGVWAINPIPSTSSVSDWSVQ